MSHGSKIVVACMTAWTLTQVPAAKADRLPMRRARPLDVTVGPPNGYGYTPQPYDPNKRRVYKPVVPPRTNAQPRALQGIYDDRVPYGDSDRIERREAFGPVQGSYRPLAEGEAPPRSPGNVRARYEWRDGYPERINGPSGRRSTPAHRDPDDNRIETMEIMPPIPSAAPANPGIRYLDFTWDNFFDFVLGDYLRLPNPPTEWRFPWHRLPRQPQLTPLPGWLDSEDSYAPPKTGGPRTAPR